MTRTEEDLEVEGALLDLMLEAQDAVANGELPENPDSKQRMEEQAQIVSELLWRRLFDER